MRRQYVGFDALRPLWVGRRLEAGLDPAVFPVAAAFGGAAGLGFKHLGVVPGLTALRDLAPAAVHGQFGRGGAFGLPLARALGVPLVVTFHGGDAHKQAHWRWVPAPALQRVRMAGMMTYASAFLCVSDGVRDRLIARGVPRELLHVHPIGVELDDAAPRMSAGESVLFIGRFVEMKGVSVLAEAVRMLRARGVTAPVVLIGDGPDRERVAQALPDVSLPGWQSADQGGFGPGAAGVCAERGGAVRRAGRVAERGGGGDEPERAGGGVERCRGGGADRGWGERAHFCHARCWSVGVGH